jgi:hypothetical protein
VYEGLTCAPCLVVCWSTFEQFCNWNEIFMSVYRKVKN